MKLAVREQLQEVREEYEAMAWYQLIEAAKSMGLLDDRDYGENEREELIDDLMALEEMAAFH